MKSMISSRLSGSTQTPFSFPQDFFLTLCALPLTPRALLLCAVASAPVARSSALALLAWPFLSSHLRMRLRHSQITAFANDKTRLGGYDTAHTIPRPPLSRLSVCAGSLLFLLGCKIFSLYLT